MITTLQIVDKILPLTKEDNRCGFKKKEKLFARNQLIIKINEYKEGKDVRLPENVLNLLQ